MPKIRSVLFVLIAVPWAVPAAAQTALVTDASVRSAPSGNVVAVLNKGTTVMMGAARGGEVYVTFTGWLDDSKLGGAKDSFPLQLTGATAKRLRAVPSLQGAILGEVRPGAGFFLLRKQSSWVNVRRGGWVKATTLPRTAPSQGPPTKPVAANPPPAPVRSEPVTNDAAAAVEPMPDGAMRVALTAKVRSAPDGLVVGQLGAGTIVSPLSRSRGWVRVRTDVWVQEKDIVPADSTFIGTLSAADLRADPEGTRGKTVRWVVQVLALQRADPLRRELAVDEMYFLAKGPGSEDVLLYLAIAPSLLDEARSVQPLTRLLVTARVRSGRSQPAGIPILDLVSFARQ